MSKKLKICRYCNKYYPESYFGVALTTKKKVYRRHKCRDCYRATKKNLWDKYRRWLVDYKKRSKCDKCGVKDYRVLEFHHLKSENKDFDIGSVFNKRYGLKGIKEEIEKCIILCANCHKILHYKERGKNRK